MDVQSIKRAAREAAKQADADIEKNIAGMPVQDRLYYLQMLCCYRLYDFDKLDIIQAQGIEHRITLDYNRLNNALWLSQQNYQRQVDLAMATNAERTKLTKQLAAGDHGFLDTLFYLLDLYSGEMIYCKMYRAMQPPMTDAEFEKIIAEVPAEYRGSMSLEEARAAVWNVVRQLNEDYEIQRSGGSAKSQTSEN